MIGENFRSKAIKLMTVLVLCFVLISCGKKDKHQLSEEDAKKVEMEFKEYATGLDAKIAPLYKEMALAYWTASISGLDEDYAKSADAEMELNKVLSDKDVFAKLKHFKETGAVNDLVLARQLKVLYDSYLAKQLDTDKLDKMTKMQNEIEKKYSNFRANVNGEILDDNAIEDILKNETDSKKLKAAWMAHKEIGPLVADDIIALVKVRNESARELGFENFHDMQLRLSELDPEYLSDFFANLDELTRDAFIELKKEIDTKLSARLNIKPQQMMPWHYQNRYFQEAPKIYDFDFDEIFENQNIEELTTKYYSSIGMEVSDMMANSDLYSKEGKNQHAYCIDIDRDALDVRVLCNIRPNSSWMETMLHEFGHAVYQKYVSEDLPWSLKTPTHIFTTEGVAMLFGRFATNAQWLKDMGIVDQKSASEIADISSKVLRLQQLVFSRWVQVMYEFEKGMYGNPDQDLNKLWWDLVEKYQMIKKPEGRDMPDWATKIHIASSPCYYHNYLLGEIWASQFYSYINNQILRNNTGKQSSFYGQEISGRFLIDRVFKVANKYDWKTMIKKATGEEFTPKYYAEQFVD